MMERKTIVLTGVEVIDAIAKGCICERWGAVGHSSIVLEAKSGKPIYATKHSIYYVDDGCPVHGKESKQEGA